MSPHTLEERLTALEKEVAEIKATFANGKRVKDWRRTIGMFSGDEIMKKIDEEALKYREADRRRARQRFSKKRKAKK